MVATTSLLVAFLMVKHCVADGRLQKAYQYLNKGTYGHPGGLLHSGIHAIGTALAILAWMWVGGKVAIPLLIVACVLDFVVHYHCDWAKMNITKRFGWASMGKDDEGRPCLRIYSNSFFDALMDDQLVHLLTYAAVVHLVAEMGGV